ncbi:hypothetical protein [Planotetraspora kaengkrachanensis]|uniref:Uncharacterized protein n=1 Tax=Planotetraspora kaengkrachanensis TaxID=575193 RepID=A0A8J3PVB9_9ACTN|nr:hypothetical protein [Planotetraspora kaengkrachanensis]GIG81766.1 hypothetical protein Pka01_48930 [Planotetraspora kaengkrachanensis]
MSRFSEELRDPWGLLLGATAGGAAWAVDVHPAGAAVVGVTVWLVKSFASAWQSTGGESRTGPEEPPVAAGSPEEAWLRRAERAASGFGDLAASMRGRILLDRIASMRPQVDDTVATLRRLAGQASVTGAALGRFDPAFLREELARLERARASAPADIGDDVAGDIEGDMAGDVTGDLDRSIASLKSQQQIHDRLSATRARVLSRLESGAIDLEGLVARAVEVSAMTAASSADDGRRDLDDLVSELELTRQSLHEVEEAARRDLGRAS